MVGEKLVANLFDEAGEVLHPVFPVMIHPLDDSLKDDLLREDSKVITGYQINDIGGRELDELLRHPNFREVLSGEALGLVEQVRAGVEVGKGHEAKTVRRMKLLSEEIAACVTNFSKVKEVGGREERLNIIFCDFNGSRVDKRDELLYCRLINLL